MGAVASSNGYGPSLSSVTVDQQQRFSGCDDVVCVCSVCVGGGGADGGGD